MPGRRANRSPHLEHHLVYMQKEMHVNQQHPSQAPCTDPPESSKIGPAACSFKHLLGPGRSQIQAREESLAFIPCILHFILYTKRKTICPGTYKKRLNLSFAQRSHGLRSPSSCSFQHRSCSPSGRAHRPIQSCRMNPGSKRPAPIPIQGLIHSHRIVR